MRQILLGAGVLAITTSTLLAAPKKKSSGAPNAKPGAKKVDADAIEMDSPNPENSNAKSADSPPLAPGNAAVAPSSIAAAPANSINDRPLVLTKDRIEIHGSLPITVVTLPTLSGQSNSSTTAGLAFGATYGISDRVEVGGGYGISLHPGDVKGALTLHGAYLALAAPTYDLAVGGAFIVHPIEFTDPASRMSFTTTYVAIQAGAWFRYRATPALTVFTGLPALPHPNISLSRSGFSFSPMPYQLTIGLNNSGAAGLSLPVGVGFQAAPNFYAFAATNLANIKLANTANALIFADFIPVTLGGFYSLKRFDVGAVFSDDLRQPTDYFAFSIVGRYHIR